MSRQLRLSARQRVAGALLELGMTLLVSGAADDTIASIALGTTNTSARPTALGDFAHVEQHGVNQATAWGVLNTFNGLWPQGASGYSKYTMSYSWSTTRPLDVNYARGKFLWAFASTVDPIASDSPITLLSGPYLIR